MLALLLLGVWTAYFVNASRYTLADGGEAWEKLGRWQMFTKRPTKDVRIVAEHQVNGVWAPLDLETLFTARWESGARYDDVEGSPGLVRMLAGAACGRDSARPARVRLSREELKLVPGRGVLSRGTNVLVDWDCDNRVRLPDGVVW